MNPPVSLTIMVNRAQKGDTRAFDCLVRLFQDRAVAYARTLLRDQNAAEDAAQEAFVQAWCDLPRLSQPEAFGGWLRRIVFKFCDRIQRTTRPSLPLTEGITIPTDQEPTALLEKAERVAEIHAALDRLPPTQREVTLLYYMTGQDVKEIAIFLEVPHSTIKNRLFTARKRLRKELWTMAETILAEEKPSQNEEFVGKVLARVLREFQEQEKTDPHTANRGLLDEGKTAIFQFVSSGQPVDFAVVQDGFLLLERKWDWSAISSLLMWFIAQPITDSQAAWAYIHLANSLSVGDSATAAGAVLAHEAFERWLPGHMVYLSPVWPYYPSDPTTDENVYTDSNEIRLLFLAQSGEFATAYVGVNRNDEYLHKVETALTNLVPHQRNLYLRFYALRMAAAACQAQRNLVRAKGYIELMRPLVDEATNERQQTNLRCWANGDAMNLARGSGDETTYEKCLEESLTLIKEAEEKGEGGAGWVRGERHNLAHQLYFNGQYGLALPIWEANANSGGQVNGWGWLLYAATVWQVTQDKERTLLLLRETRARDDRDMMPLFLERPEFATVKDDAAFLEAIRRAEKLKVA